MLGHRLRDELLLLLFKLLLVLNLLGLGQVLAGFDRDPSRLLKFCWLGSWLRRQRDAGRRRRIFGKDEVVNVHGIWVVVLRDLLGRFAQLSYAAGRILRRRAADRPDSLVISICPSMSQAIVIPYFFCICSLCLRIPTAIMRHVKFSMRSWLGMFSFVLAKNFHICVASGSFCCISSKLWSLSPLAF